MSVAKGGHDVFTIKKIDLMELFQSTEEPI